VTVLPDDVGGLGSVVEEKRDSKEVGVLAVLWIIRLLKPKSGLVSLLFSESDESLDRSSQRVVVLSFKIHNLLLDHLLLLKVLVNDAGASLSEQEDQLGVVEGKHDICDLYPLEFLVMELLAFLEVGFLDSKALLEVDQKSLLHFVFQIALEGHSR
jgi:hypothetical protein